MNTTLNPDAARSGGVNYTADAEAAGLAPNIQTRFARLQMAQAHACKKAAAEKLEDVKAIQREQNAVRKIFVRLQSCRGGNVQRADIKDVETFLNARGISLSFKTETRMKYRGGYFEKKTLEFCRNEETDINLKKIGGLQEEINAKAQSAITLLQDFMAQYNSYLDGSRAAMARATSVMSKLAANKG